MSCLAWQMVGSWEKNTELNHAFSILKAQFVKQEDFQKSQLSAKQGSSSQQGHLMMIILQSEPESSNVFLEAAIECDDCFYLNVAVMSTAKS